MVTHYGDHEAVVEKVIQISPKEYTVKQSLQIGLHYIKLNITWTNRGFFTLCLSYSKMMAAEMKKEMNKDRVSVKGLVTTT